MSNSQLSKEIAQLKKNLCHNSEIKNSSATPKDSQVKVCIFSNEVMDNQQKYVFKCSIFPHFFNFRLLSSANSQKLQHNSIALVCAQQRLNCGSYILKNQQIAQEWGTKKYVKELSCPSLFIQYRRQSVPFAFSIVFLFYTYGFLTLLNQTFF